MNRAMTKGMTKRMNADMNADMSADSAIGFTRGLLEHHVSFSRRALAVGVALSVALGSLSTPVLAQSASAASTPMSDMPGMHAHSAMTSSSAAAPGSTSTPNGEAAVKAFKAADHHMMQQMSAGYTGNTDQDFVTHMLPHHEGAVQMAKIELKYGTDPELKRLAHDIIKAQDKEIQFMKTWQAKHPS